MIVEDLLSSSLDGDVLGLADDDDEDLGEELELFGGDVLNDEVLAGVLAS